MSFTEKYNIQGRWGVGFHEKPIKRVFPKKGGLRQFADLRGGGLVRNTSCYTPMHTTSSQNLLRTNLQILNAWSFFCFIQLIGNITISCNYHVRIYKSHMHKYLYFCSLTKFLYKCCVQTYWSCIHKCIGTYRKILVNW